LHDVLIIGAGPAGATAAALLAGQERSVVLIDRAVVPRPRRRTVWTNARALLLLKEIGGQEGAAGAVPFSEVTFHSGDLSKTAKAHFRETPGYVVRREAFEAALVQAAVAAGTELRAPWPITDIDLCEEHVELTAESGDALRGRMLLAATGHGSSLTERITKSRQVPSPTQWTVKVEAALNKPGKTSGAVSVVLGLDRRGAFGLVILHQSRVAVSAGGQGAGEEAVDLLVGLCRRLTESGIIPIDLAPEAARARVRPSPAGTALEMDSHVAKHALLIGDAGGFVSAASQEGIYPAMWSAQLAVEVIAKALDSEHSQDVLMEFDPKWRMAMAEYLRPPNTDIQFLLPLIFSNQPMADRMGAAFFLGQSI